MLINTFWVLAYLLWGVIGAGLAIVRRLLGQ
jgi:hypothetical protein